MAGPSNLKTLNSIHIPSNNIKPPFSPSPSSSLNNSMKLKTLLQTFVLSHVYRLIRALARAKSVVIQLLRDARFLQVPLKKNKGKQKKLFFGSFRLHYNWCSSESNSCVYYDSGWTSVIQKTTRVASDYDDVQLEPVDSELSKYLKWLEEKGGGGGDDTEIDKLADLFIANCHEKFRLEKQESYRRFQEMMARSV